MHNETTKPFRIIASGNREKFNLEFCVLSQPGIRAPLQEKSICQKESPTPGSNVRLPGP